MDPFRFTTIGHANRTVLGPVSDGTIDAVFDAIAHDVAPGERIARVLDIGCGKGEMLVRAIIRFGATGVGVEPNPAFAAEARARAAGAGIPDWLTLHEATLENVSLPHGTFDVAVCTGASHAFGLYRDALRGLRAFLRPEGWLIVGEGYWRQPPELDYLKVFGGDGSDIPTREELLAGATTEGLHVLTVRESSLEDWDAYEDGYAASIRVWLGANDADPDAPAFRERIERWNAAYRRWGRGTLGFAMLALSTRAPRRVVG